jgi:hypothetical protein
MPVSDVLTVALALQQAVGLGLHLEGCLMVYITPKKVYTTLGIYHGIQSRKMVYLMAVVCTINVYHGIYHYYHGIYHKYIPWYTPRYIPWYI